jgi:EmrB/QacA subfamily drug resistance transporter
LLCSIAPNAWVLVASRALQAVGGAMLNPVAMSIIVNTFLDPKERARAVGIWGAAFGVAMAAGPLLGGLLVQSVGWRSIFWVNIPLGVVALVLSGRFIRESRAERARRLDPVAQLLVIAALFALTSAVIDGRQSGWTSWPIAVGFATAVASAVGLVAWESFHPEPMLDPRFFRSLPFAGATVVAVLAFASFSGFLFLNSLYLQGARGLSACQAGLATLPIALALMVCSPLSGRLVGAGRARLALVVAGTAMATGALLLTALAEDTNLTHLLVAYGIFGIGLGMVNAPITNTAVSGMPRSHAGIASAVATTSRQVGASLGVALAGSLAGTGIESVHGQDFAAATHVFFWVSTGLGMAIVVLGIASTGARARASASRVAGLLDGTRQ